MVVGDPTDPLVLADARVDRAGHFVSVCSDDAVSLEVLQAVARLCGASQAATRPHLIARVEDTRLRERLERQSDE